MKFAKGTLIAASLLALGLSAPAMAQTKPTKITIATEGAYAPYNFSTADGKLDGFEIELANDLCARMKVECKIIAQDWDGIIPSLTANKYDAIMAGMNATAKRRDVIDFSNPYVLDAGGFAGKKGEWAALGDVAAKINLDDAATAKAAIDKMKAALKGKTVGVQVATNNLDLLNKYFKDTVKIKEYKTTEQHDLDLKAGRVDLIFAQQTAIAATLDKPEFAKFALASSGFVGDVMGGGVSVGLRKADTELKGMFNDAIAAAIADGTVKKLSMKWFKMDVSPKK